jgi:hypothetical protein
MRKLPHYRTSALIMVNKETTYMRAKEAQNVKSKLTNEQLLALIPGGGIHAERVQHATIETECIAENTKGDALVTRQRKLSPVDKLRISGAISENEVKAAQQLKNDYDLAYRACKNVLAGIRVDSCGVAAGAAESKFRQVRAGQRFRGALKHLGNQLARVATSGIVDAEVDKKVGTVFQQIGTQCLPHADRHTRYGAGMGMLALACRELAIHYGYRKPDALPGID